MIPLIVGTVLAVGALTFVLYPIFFGARQTKQAAPVAVDKLSINDEIETAVRAYRDKKHDRCAACGTPVGARDARYCSNCGNRLPA
jgi:hypothetical protein